jgi:hypothetical protein
MWTVEPVTRIMAAVVALLLSGCAMADAGEVDAPMPAPGAGPSTTPSVVVDDPEVPPPGDPASGVSELVGEPAADIAAELEAMEADLAALDELLSDASLEGTEP